MKIFFLFGFSCLCWASAKPSFTQLLNNARWYRSYDSASTIIPADGALLFAWDFVDSAKQVDSFYVGIDTLWGLPQNVGGDTASDWDLQICPDEICLNGLKAGVHGANSPYPFGPTKSKAEHHLQFFPAISAAYDFIAPAKSLFGAMIFCRSRSTGLSDTVLAFGAWKLTWDVAFPPPPRLVDGYLPKRSDFVIIGDTVRYLKVGSQIRKGSKIKSKGRLNVKVSSNQEYLQIDLMHSVGPIEIGIYSWQGKKLWTSGRMPLKSEGIKVRTESFQGGAGRPGYYWVGVKSSSGLAWASVLLLSP